MLRVAVPNKGALSEAASQILAEAGYRQRRSTKDLVLVDADNDVEFFYLRPRDIAVYVGEGTLDVGITGRDLLLDSAASATEQIGLGFGRSTFRFAAPTGTPLMAIANGVVTSVGYEGAYGNQTILTLEDGTEIWYNHQTSYDVSVGDNVVAGQVIGTVGSTGNVTGPHLHLEVRPGGGDPVDPYAALVVNGVNP